MSLVKIEGGSLSVDARPETHEVALVAERVRDAEGPAMKLSVIMGHADAQTLHTLLGLAIEEIAPNDLERMRVRHLAVFGDAAVPEWVRGSIARYIDDGIPTGDFMRAVLANDLQGAFARADVETAKAMPAIVSWVYNRVPRNLCGNYAVVDSYIHAQIEIRRRAAEAKS